MDCKFKYKIQMSTSRSYICNLVGIGNVTECKLKYKIQGHTVIFCTYKDSRLIIVCDHLLFFLRHEIQCHLCFLTFIQTIEGSDLKPSIATFGWSLSGGQDLDGNRYPGR